MVKYSLILLFFYFAWIELQAQQSHYTQSGYTSLSIDISGNYPKEINFSIPFSSGPLSDEKPIGIDAINETTYLIAFYTFGPTTVYFNFNGRYLTTVLLPNKSDQLQIHFQDSVNFTMNYDGYFKEVFDHSHIIPELIQKVFNYDGEPTLKTEVETNGFLTANHFRDYQVEKTHAIIRDISADIESPTVKQIFTLGVEGFLKSIRLFDYEKTVTAFYKDNGIEITPPRRDLSYYEHIIEEYYADTTVLLSNSLYRLLNRIIKDPLLDLPAITEAGPRDYFMLLEKAFGKIFPNGNNLFYDMLIANAYIDRISNHAFLTTVEKHEVLQYFNNKYISDFILFQNEILEKSQETPTHGLYYLPFSEDTDSIFSNILSLYNGKVVFVDVWATWCGPCLVGFSQLKGVKERYAARDDVVFVYLTNESSDIAKWTEFVKAVGGEHYYLYNHQQASIGNQFNFKYIPTYLIFDKNGALTASHKDGTNLESEKAILWIESALQH